MGAERGEMTGSGFPTVTPVWVLYILHPLLPAYPSSIRLQRAQLTPTRGFITVGLVMKLTAALVAEVTLIALSSRASWNTVLVNLLQAKRKGSMPELNFWAPEITFWTCHTAKESY